MLYIRTWPIPKKLQTPDTLIVKIDKNHQLYPPDYLINDFAVKFDKLVDDLAKNLYAIDQRNHEDIWDMWDAFRDKARVYIRDSQITPWYKTPCTILDECLKEAYTGRDVIIAVCENRPFYSSWRRILCEYVAGHWKAWDEKTWQKGHDYAIQIDNFPPNIIPSYNGKPEHVLYTYLRHPATGRIRDVEEPKVEFEFKLTQPTPNPTPTQNSEQNQKPKKKRTHRGKRHHDNHKNVSARS